MMKLILYHGTDSAFREIDLSKSFGGRDFGIGFYTTTISTQAESWARSKKRRNLSRNAYVYVYSAEITEDILVKNFEGLSEEWLEMVKENRKMSGVQHNYDIVIGPVANDDTMLTVTRYMQGVYSAAEAIKRLSFSRVNDQVSFHTERAVKCLRFVRRYTVE